MNVITLKPSYVSKGVSQVLKDSKLNSVLMQLRLQYTGHDQYCP